MILALFQRLDLLGSGIIVAGIRTAVTPSLSVDQNHKVSRSVVAARTTTS